MRTKVRWRAKMTYRGANGPINVPHELFELYELHEIVELGPHWDTLIDIAIERINPVYDRLTLERAETL